MRGGAAGPRRQTPLRRLCAPKFKFLIRAGPAATVLAMVVRSLMIITIIGAWQLCRVKGMYFFGIANKVNFVCINQSLSSETQ